MLYKELKNRVPEKGLTPILLMAPVVMADYGEKEQSGSKPGSASGEDFTGEATEYYD